MAAEVLLQIFRRRDREVTAERQSQEMETENQMRGCKKISLAILLTLVSAGLAAAQAPAYTATLQNQLTTNSCSAGEPVALSGAISYQVAVSPDAASGQNTFTITASNNLIGVGQTTTTSYPAGDSSDYLVSSSQPSNEAG